MGLLSNLPLIGQWLLHIVTPFLFVLLCTKNWEMPAAGSQGNKRWNQAPQWQMSTLFLIFIQGFACSVWLTLGKTSAMSIQWISSSLLTLCPTSSLPFSTSHHMAGNMNGQYQKYLSVPCQRQARTLYLNPNCDLMWLEILKIWLCCHLIPNAFIYLFIHLFHFS